MFKKTIITSLFTLGISAASFANAGNLTIINDTNEDSTTMTHSCSSSILQDAGVTKRHSTHEVPEYQLKLACLTQSQNDCKAIVYMTDNCTGPVVANVTIDIRNGVKDNIQMVDARYKIEFPDSGNRFKVRIRYA